MYIRNNQQRSFDQKPSRSRIMIDGKDRRRTPIDQCKQGMEGTFEVYVLVTLDIDGRLSFDNPDALLQCQRFKYKS